jgi:hypothetical protein
VDLPREIDAPSPLGHTAILVERESALRTCLKTPRQGLSTG